MSTMSGIDRIPKADADLLIAAIDADLHGMKLALEAGARPHFWLYEAEDMKNHSPASTLLKHERDDPDLKIAGLDLLHQYGLSYCEASEDKHASVMGAINLKDRPREYNRLVEWFLGKEIGLSIEEGVGHWLKDALTDFKHNHATRVLSYLTKNLEGKQTPELFPTMLSASIPNSVGASVLMLSRSPACEEDHNIREFLNAMKGVWHRLMGGNVLLKKSQSSHEDLLLSFCMFDLSGLNPDQERFERGFYMVKDYMQELYPYMERVDWEAHIDKEIQGNVGSFYTERKKWGIDQVRRILVDQEAQMISSQTQPLKNSVPKSRL